jgi:muramidase (phage lysozyme)
MTNSATDKPRFSDEQIAEALKLLRGNNSILKAREERRQFIQFCVVCAVCVVLANSSTAIARTVYSAHYNYTQLTKWWDSCKSKPWDCIRGKVPGPAWNITASPEGNVAAMLDLIAWAEGTDNHYNMIYTGARFDDFSRHPDRVLCSGGICSSAAGRYQFLTPTWNKLQTQLKLPDFSPASQDKAAIELIKQCNGYGAAVRGDVQAFTDRCWITWASLQSGSGKKLDARQKSYGADILARKFAEFQRDRSLGNGEFAKPLPNLTVTSPMSASRTHPTTGEVRPHNGTDYACNAGDVVKSPISGTFRKGNSDPQGFGNSWGTVAGSGYEVTIGHTRKLLVKDGQVVQHGQPIAECGSEGTGSGPHLHIEIREDGQLINPEEKF